MLTELTEEAVGETLLPALPLLSCAQHLVVVAGAEDPDVARWAGDTPTEAASAYRKAAAVAGPRARASGPPPACGASGATVVDAPPGKLAAGAWPTPTSSLKATGRL